MKRDKSKLHLCFIGNMVGRNEGYIPTQGMILADLFAGESYQITCVSSKINRASRLAEIIFTLIKKRGKSDIVILDVYSGLSFIIAEATAFLCKILRLPLIMVLRGGSLPEFMEKNPRRTKRVFDSANVLIAPSAFLAEKFKQFGFETKVITNVVNLVRYPFRERSKIAPRLMWMRSFHPVYNPEMAIKVLAKLRQTESEAVLTMAGNDKGLEDEVKKLAAEKNLTDAVRFAGFLDFERKIKEFSEADIYLNTNRIDNMPVSVVEARALGLPVVATNVGGLPYLIKEKKDGLLVPSEDADAMVEAIKMLLDNPQLTRDISRNGRHLAEESAWENVRKEWEKLFVAVINKSQIEKPAIKNFSKLKSRKSEIRNPKSI